MHEKGFCPGGHQASRAQNLSFFGYGNVLVLRFRLAPPNLLRGMSWGEPGAAGCWVPRQNTPGGMGGEASISPVCAPEPYWFQPGELLVRSMCSMPSPALLNPLAEAPRPPWQLVTSLQMSRQEDSARGSYA